MLSVRMLSRALTRSLRAAPLTQMSLFRPLSSLAGTPIRPTSTAGRTNLRRPAFFSSLAEHRRHDELEQQQSLLSESNPSLRTLLMSDCLAVQREIEHLNVLIGYEQANKYSIRNRAGEIIGFICETGDGIGKALARNVMNTHRTLNADVLDAAGHLLFRITKPMHLVQSELHIDTPTAQRIGTVKMDWHLLKRRYDLFLGTRQFARVDGEFLAWEFNIVDQSLGKLAVVDRNWMGLVRELVADAGRYCVYFGRGDGSEIDRFDASVCPPNSFFDFKDTAQFPSQTGASAPPSLPEQQNNEPALLNNQSKSADKQSKQWYDEAPPQTQGEWWNTLKTKGTSKSSTSKSLTAPPATPAPVNLMTLPASQGGPQPSEPLPSFYFNGRELSMDERAIVLAMAVLIDNDYFSHKSSSTGGMFPFIPFMGSSPTPMPVDPSAASVGAPQAADAVDVPSSSSPNSDFSFDSQNDLDSTSRRGMGNEMGNSDNDPEMMQDRWSSSSDKFDKSNGGSDSSDSGDSGDGEGGGIISSIFDFFGGGN